MTPLRPISHLAGLLATLATLIIAPAASQADYSISDNLSGTSGGVESAVDSTWIAAGFAAGPTGGLLSSVTLKLAEFAPGQAEVDIYSDSILEPGTLLGQLTLAGSYSATATPTTFIASGITLAANTNYWVVLKAVSGQFDWSWTSDNVGTGVGYQNTWGSSDDSGGTWFTYDSYPTQMNVTLVSAAAVPEPATALLWGLAGVGIALHRQRTGSRAIGTR